MRLLVASIAPRALNSELWVRRLVNSCGHGFLNGGPPVWGGTTSLRLTMALVKKTPTVLSGAWLTMPTRCGLSVIG